MVPSAPVQMALSAILPVSNLHAFERFHMGIALLALSGLFQGFGRFNPSVASAARAPRVPRALTLVRSSARTSLRPALRPIWTTRPTPCPLTGIALPTLPHRAKAKTGGSVGAAAASAVAVAAAGALAAAPTLRVLCVTDPGPRAKGVGRMRISGRMADVCAELDRLAALEAKQARI